LTVPIRPEEPLGGSRLPWKSLIAKSWIVVVGAFAGAGFASAAGFADASVTPKTSSTPMQMAASTPQAGRLIFVCLSFRGSRPGGADPHLP
jgi:hypothetical protein